MILNNLFYSISVGIQCLEALEDLHGIGYLHRDVKPANYTIGRAELKELRKVYVLDFGMARKFVHEDGTIKKPRTVAGFRGTVKYAPVACHAQREMCRLDDLESWLYQQVEFTKGALPWRNLTNMDDIGRYKKSCRGDHVVKQLFDGCPREYVDVMRTTDGGRFFDKSDYLRITTYFLKVEPSEDDDENFKKKLTEASKTEFFVNYYQDMIGYLFTESIFKATLYAYDICRFKKNVELELIWPKTVRRFKEGGNFEFTTAPENVIQHRDMRKMLNVIQKNLTRFGCINAKIGGHDVVAMINCGANTNVLPLEMAKNLGIHKKMKQCCSVVEGVRGKVAATGYIIDQEISIGGVAYRTDFCILDKKGTDCLILGIKFLGVYDGVLKFKENKVVLGENEINLVDKAE
uniref:non-specific serine/threonine protein kinase n=1 Tax=Panagrolaimus superbus TaxID=310955 RepID=A0A914YG71_9BILA